MLVWGTKAALAAFYGGMAVAAMPTVYVAWRVFSRSQDAPPEEVVGRFYQGEVGKFGMTTMLFFIGVFLFAQQFLAVLLGYIAAQAAYWIVMAQNGAFGSSKS